MYLEMLFVGARTTVKKTANNAWSPRACLTTLGTRMKMCFEFPIRYGAGIIAMNGNNRLAVLITLLVFVAGFAQAADRMHINDARGDASVSAAADLRRATAVWKSDGTLRIALQSAGLMVPEGSTVRYWLAIDFGLGKPLADKFPRNVFATLSGFPADLVAAAHITPRSIGCDKIDEISIDFWIRRDRTGLDLQKHPVGTFETLCTVFSAFDKASQSYREVRVPTAHRLTFILPPELFSGAMKGQIRAFSTEEGQADKIDRMEDFSITKWR